MWLCDRSDKIFESGGGNTWSTSTMIFSFFQTHWTSHPSFDQTPLGQSVLPPLSSPNLYYTCNNVSSLFCLGERWQDKTQMSEIRGSHYPLHTRGSSSRWTTALPLPPLSRGDVIRRSPRDIKAMRSRLLLLVPPIVPWSASLFCHYGIRWPEIRLRPQSSQWFPVGSKLHWGVSPALSLLRCSSGPAASGAAILANC